VSFNGSTAGILVVHPLPLSKQIPRFKGLYILVSIHGSSNIRALQLHFNQLVGELNVLGLVNSAVVVQEYLDGPEYVVDTGKHVFLKN
jgi:hypothetical protein